MSKPASVIDNVYIEFHDNIYSAPFNVVDESERFGIIHVKIKPVQILPTPLFILFTLDRTGSMQEVSEDNITNMRYAIQTMQNMMHYLAKQKSTVYIQINIFNSVVETLIEPTKIRNDNVVEICDTIDRISAQGITNIGAALQTAADTIRAYSDENPTHNVAHVFMTDGEPTDGECDTNNLTSYVNTSYPNMNIGFGYRHNVYLMRRLSELERSYYSFVDDAKNTSMVYGEIMHMLLYPAMKDVVITVENGAIYNWRNNIWDTCFAEPFLISDSEKMYHIKTTNADEMHVELKGQIVSAPNDAEPRFLYKPYCYYSTKIDRIPDLINSAGEITVHSNLTPYIFRQKVQEMLFMGRNECIPNVSSYKTELSQIFHEIRGYMKREDKTTDPFFNQLCDDLSITYKTCSLEFGALYAMARSITQGSQQSYTPQLPSPRSNRYANIPPGIPYPPKLKRGIQYESIVDICENNIIDEITQYESKQSNTSCYASPSALAALNAFRA